MDYNWSVALELSQVVSVFDGSFFFWGGGGGGGGGGGVGSALEGACF